MSDYETFFLTYGFLIIGVIIGMIFIIYCLWLFYIAIKYSYPNKAIWIIAIILTGWVGAILFRLIVYPKIDKTNK